MRKWFMLCIVACLGLALSVSAQDATANSVTVSDQVSLNGMVVVDSVTIDVAGFVAIHADEGGMPGHVVGIAPVPAGTSEGVLVMIDGAMATPTLYAALHADDNTAGVFEFGHVPGADPLVSEPAPFSGAAIVAFDQQLMNDTLVVASAISPVDGWLVVHADNGGQPGPVIGFSPVVAGTNAPVMVALGSEGITPAVWPMLHVDDGEAGAYEFDGESGLDNPIVINGVVATKPVNLTDAPTLLLADNTPVTSAFIPAVNASAQELTGNDDGSATFVVDLATAPAQSFIDVHADMGHPATSLGVTLINEGDNENVEVMLMPPPEGSVLGITPTVWPMLHLDTDGDGEYRYLQIPGVDLPIVYNGAVVTVPVSVSGDMVTEPPMDMMGGEATEEPMGEATMEMGGNDMESTPEGEMEATMEAGDMDATMEATDEMMATAEATAEGG